MVRGLRIASIVEGDGEEGSLHVLLERIGYELLGAEFIDVLQPDRKRKNRLVKDIDGELSKAVSLAARGLVKRGGDGLPTLILILLDEDDDCAKTIAPNMNGVARAARSDFRSACVVAVKEYETWFVAAAQSLAQYLVLGTDDPPADPEGQRCGKGWIEARYRGRKQGRKYSPTVDQPRMTAAMDLRVCRER